MEQWFGVGESGFELFGIGHLISLLVIVFIVLIMYFFRTRLKEISFIRIILLICLALSEVSYQCWALYNGIWTVKLYLPLQLCSLNILLCMVLLVTENKKLFAFVYLFGLTGSIQGLLTPELYQEPWHFRFIQYFFAHGLIVWTALYYAIIRSLRIAWRRFFKSFLWLNFFAACVYLINVLLNTNYMFLMSKPRNASIMDFLGPYPWYILGLELIAFFICLLVLIPVLDQPANPIHKDRSPIGV
ncbi:TIGR02206 family membrane protein [Fictibacillus phosphorivorans]|uniref:YwaF family protein n=1 Tax=Fictibacillus phosphorivorans TaxID=1221500 RepID=UPI0020411FFF|nr:TIGR02206 family membrane protein [Fictibacillus phosphorivorans]MCM3717538.1 TIGR02206 family membrane protein [Fictibacillus phosphorivorans]MCM3775233.1 TIGR02206 family membrane protein [Fictibacillus phosphorivorans]